MKGQVVKLERDPVAFLYETLIERVRFSEATFPVLFIVTMFAIAMVTDKDLFDMGWGSLDITPVLINVAEEEAQDNALVPDIDAGEDLFAFDSRLCINDHVFSPAVAAADLPAKTVSESGHFTIKGKHELLIAGRDEVKSSFLQKALHCLFPFNVIRLAYFHPVTQINSR